MYGYDVPVFTANVTPVSVAAVGAVAAVQVPAADQRPGPQGAQQGQLVLDGRHLGVQAQAVGDRVARTGAPQGGRPQ